MPTIQAYRRTKETTQAAAGLSLVFKPNAEGHVVCDVDNEQAIDFLLGEPTAFRLYGPVETAPVKTPEVESQSAEAVGLLVNLPVEVASPYLLEDEESKVSIDLRLLSDAELQAFAQANGIKASKAAKGDALRDKIIESLSQE